MMVTSTLVEIQDTGDPCKFMIFFQNFLIRDAQPRADRADVRSHGNEVTVQMLQDQIDHLSLAVYAMAELLENVGFTNEMLLAKLKRST